MQHTTRKMKSIFWVLVIVTALENISAKALPDADTDDVKENSSVEQSPPNVQLPINVERCPAVVSALIEMPAEQVDQMIPHIKAIVDALENHPMGQIFASLLNMCQNQPRLKQMKEVYDHVSQFLSQGSGVMPVKLKHTTKINVVNPIILDQNSATGGYVTEMAAANQQVQHEILQQLNLLKTEAQQTQVDVQREVIRQNSVLRDNMQQMFLQTRNQMVQMIGALKDVMQRVHADMEKRMAWLRHEMRTQLEQMAAELNTNYRASKEFVNRFRSDIHADLREVNEQGRHEVARIAGDLKHQVGGVRQQLSAQLDETQTGMNDEIERMRQIFGAQVADIRGAMNEMVQQMRNDMQTVDNEMRQAIEKAYQDAAGANAERTKMNAPMREEMEKAMAEMRSTTNEMREKMEKEIQNAIRGLTAEIESIIKEMKTVKNGDALPGRAEDAAQRTESAIANEATETDEAAVKDAGMGGDFVAKNAIEQSATTGTSSDATNNAEAGNASQKSDNVIHNAVDDAQTLAADSVENSEEDEEIIDDDEGEESFDSLF